MQRTYPAYFSAKEIAGMGMKALPPCKAGICRLAMHRSWHDRTIFGMPLALQLDDGEWVYHRFLIIFEWLLPSMPQWRCYP